MKEIKYKIGDKVRVIACHWGHGLKIGSIVEITEVREWNIDYGIGCWSVRNDELEPVNDQEDAK